MHGSGTSVGLEMSIMLFVALGGYLLASRIRQPSVVGQIILGVVIGPSVLGWIDYSTFVNNAAQLGATILLFVVGLEFKLEEISRPRYFVIGLFGVLVPWLGGYLSALLFGFEPSKAMLIGVALSATSIAITADTLRELGKLDTEAARAIIGAAVIDDVLALLALAVFHEVTAEAIDALALAGTLLRAVLFLGLGAWTGAKVMKRIVHSLDESRLARGYPEIVFVFVMMMAFLYSIIAEYMGLSAVIGAFVAGVALEGVDVRHARSFHEGSDFLRIVFGAIFFVSLGILADLSALTANMLLFCIVLTVVAVVSKLIGCGLPAYFTGSSRRDALAIGVGMAPRGEIAMVVALMAFNAGIIAQSAYVVLVLMSLLTTVTVPLVLRNWVYRTHKEAD